MASEYLWRQEVSRAVRLPRFLMRHHAKEMSVQYMVLEGEKDDDLVIERGSTFGALYV